MIQGLPSVARRGAALDKSIEGRPGDRFNCLSAGAGSSGSNVTARDPGGGVRVSHHRQRVTVFYSGRVQGVGFRFSVRDLATGFDVTGTVRNLDDGRVELIAEGTREEIEAFRDAIRQSGLGPMIRDEGVFWSPAQGNVHGFAIVR
jgi:acylphosphatase